MGQPSEEPEKIPVIKRMNKEPGGRLTASQVRLWKTHREDSVFFQREAQVNFWTVLGGLCVAALLTQLSPLVNEIQNSRWFLLLYLISSILILANSWVQTSWGSLVMKWPISIITTVIMLFQMLIQAIQCLVITLPAVWFAATAGIILFAIFNQVYFALSGAWVVYTPASIQRYKWVIWVYVILMFICIAASIHLYFLPGKLVETLWGLAAIMFSIAALYIQHQGMQLEKKNLGIP